MKTNGSADPQTAEDNVVRERRALPASLQPPTPPQPSSVPHTSRTRVPFSVHRIRQISLHVNRVIPGWLEILLEYLMCRLM